MARTRTAMMTTQPSELAMTADPTRSERLSSLGRCMSVSD
jgi:hypothetical protein